MLHGVQPGRKVAFTRSELTGIGDKRAMDNPSLLDAARRRWWVIVLLATVGFTLGALPAPAKVVESSAFTTYYARHTMLLNNDASLNGNTAVSPNQVPLLATTGEVPKRVAEQIGYTGGFAVLATEVTVNFDFNTGALTVETTQDAAASAEQIADVFADNINSYLIERQDQIYQDRLAASISRLDELEKKLDDLTAELAIEPDDPVLIAQRDAVSRQYSVAFEQNESLTESPSVLAFTTLERAQAIEQTNEAGGLSAPTSRWVRGLMGMVAGLVLGIGVVVVLSLLDRRLRTREQAEAVMGIRARVTIPKVKGNDLGGLVVTSGRHDPLSDSYRTLRNVISFVHSGLEPVDRARITVVVSPGPGEGKTSLAANLAAAFVESGQRTIVANTDFRRPRLARAITGMPVTQHPFTLQDVDTLPPEWTLSATRDQDLSILDLSGLGSTGELARATAKLVPRLAETCDAIVIDTSPIGATAEPLELVPIADVIVVVARVGQTNIETAQRTIAILRDLTTAPILLVLTGLSPEKTAYYEYTDRRAEKLEAKKVGRSKLRTRRKYTGDERRKPEITSTEVSGAENEDGEGDDSVSEDRERVGGEGNAGGPRPSRRATDPVDVTESGDRLDDDDDGRDEGQGDKGATPTDPMLAAKKPE